MDKHSFPNGKRLVRDTLKPDDNLHYEKFSDGTVKCIEDEIPFELPEGWEWTRLGCITDVIQYGLSNSAESTGDYRLLRITDIQNGCVNWDTVPFTSTDEPEKYLLHKDDIVFARTGATVGKSFLITDLPYASVYASYLIRIRLINGISANYIYHFFNSYCYWEQVTDKAVGVGQPNCNGTALRELFIPLPSQAEQNRIVPVADNLLKIVDTITFEQESLSELIQTTKSKILDLAIRGKLVPQDPNDEPASVLLERIRAEKEELIKQGKIKRDKKESVIFKGDDNSYYQDLPSNWIKIRLSTISEIITKGTTPRGGKVAYSQSGIGFLRAENIAGYDKLDLSNLNYVDEESHNNYLKRSILKENDILITIAGTLGRTAIVPQQALPLNTNQAVAIVRLVNNRLINVKYLVYALNSPIIKSDLLAKSVDMAIPNLSLENIADCNISLPPLVEQKRIVDEIEKIFAVLDDIVNQVA